MPATEIIETSKNWHQIIQIRINRLSPRPLTICSLPEKSIEDIEVDAKLVKARNRRIESL